MSANAAPEGGIDLEEALDRLSLKGRPLWVVVIMAAVLIADGFDIILLGFVAPAVAEEFGLSHGGIGAVLTASLLGVALGGFLGGYYGDRKGRRTLVAACLLVFGGATIASALVDDIVLFSITRLIAGLGLGGATPNAAALMTEMLPSRWRSQIITIAYASSTIGTTLAGLLARQMLPDWGWRGLFLAGGILPLAICLFVFLLVPESPKYLVSLKDGSARAAKALNRLMGHAAYSAGDRFRVPSASGKGSFADIVSPAYRRDTICLALMIFMILFSWVALGNWGTIVLTSLGHDMQSAVSVMMGYNLAGLGGAVAVAFLLNRLGSRRIFAALAVTGIVTTAALGLALDAGPVSLGVMAVGILIAGAALTALLQASYPVVANAYPTDFRALGLGSTFGFGRLGAVTSSMVTAVLMTKGGAPLFFMGIAAASFCVLLAVLAVRRHVAPAA